MQQIVIDTNVLVAAGFNKRSSASKIIKMIESDELINIWHKKTLGETKIIIEKIPPLDWNNFKDLYKSENEYKVELKPEKFSYIEDRDDRKFASLAHETNCVLISNDNHLLSVRSKLPVVVKTTVEFVSE